jgi:hypothetical protein
MEACGESVADLFSVPNRHDLFMEAREFAAPPARRRLRRRFFA